MKAAMINSDGIVENIIMWDDQSIAPFGFDAVILEDNVSVSTGFIHEDGHTFRDPNPMPQREEITPPEPTLAELKAQLLSLEAQIQSLANQQTTPKAS